MTREAQLELKCRLLSAALERAHHDDASVFEAFPLCRLVMIEREVRSYGRALTFHERIQIGIADMTQSFFSVPKFPKPSPGYSGGKSISVPISYSESTP